MNYCTKVVIKPCGDVHEFLVFKIKQSVLHVVFHVYKNV
jgi:hypothetical protein